MQAAQLNTSTQTKAHPTVVQPKLQVNIPGDKYEQEADAMAERVMSFGHNPNGFPISKINSTGSLMRSGGESGIAVSDSFSNTLARSKGAGSPLSASTNGFMENAFSADFSSVRIHTGEQAAELAGSIQAKAFTHGNDLYFNEGRYNPESSEGKSLLAHELTHTIQQGDTGLSNATLIQRQPDTQAATPATATQADQNPLPESVQKRIIYASTVFRRIAPLPAEDQELLNKIIKATRVYGVTLQKKDFNRHLEYEESRGMGIEKHAPENIDENQRLADLIDKELKELGIANVDELYYLVNTVFPQMLLTRAKELALTMLDENEDAALAEQQRYSEEVCSPDTEGLLDADAELGAIQNEILSTEKEAQDIATRGVDIEYRHNVYDLPPGETPSAGVYDPSEYEKYQQDIADNQDRAAKTTWDDLEKKRQELAKQYPIIGAQGYSPGMFSAAPREDLAKVVEGPVKTIIDNIRTVRGAIIGDDLKVWNLTDVINMTEIEMGVQDEPILIEAINNEIKDEQTDELFIGLAKAALAITTTILASVVAGPLGAAVVGGLWSAGFLYQDIKQYSLEESADNVALDPEFRDISINEPEVLWIVLDVVFLGLDAIAAVKALRPFARALTATRSVEDFGRFAEATRTVLGADEAAAEEIISKTARRFGIDPELALQNETQISESVIQEGGQVADESIDASKQALQPSAEAVKRAELAVTDIVFKRYGNVAGGILDISDLSKSVYAGGADRLFIIGRGEGAVLLEVDAKLSIQAKAVVIGEVSAFGTAAKTGGASRLELLESAFKANKITQLEFETLKESIEQGLVLEEVHGFGSVYRISDDLALGQVSYAQGDQFAHVTEQLETRATRQLSTDIKMTIVEPVANRTRTATMAKQLWKDFEDAFK